jgi:hypothetical protein
LGKDISVKATRIMAAVLLTAASGLLAMNAAYAQAPGIGRLVTPKQDVASDTPAGAVQF